MRLFSRISDIIAANLNDLVDRVEDPEVMLKQAIREMETTIAAATGATARALAAERLLNTDRVEQERQAGRWRAVAEQAVSDGDDDLARKAIARAYEHEELASALARQHASAVRAADALRRQVKAMRAKQAEARRKLASFSARRRLAEASRALAGTTCESLPGPDGFSRFERMRRQVEQAEAEAEALGELYEGVESTWEAETASREQARRVEAELAAMKERLRSSHGPGEVERG